MLEYHAAMVELSNRLLELLAAGLGLPPSWLAENFNHPLNFLRALHYGCVTPCCLFCAAWPLACSLSATLSAPKEATAVHTPPASHLMHSLQRSGWS